MKYTSLIGFVCVLSVAFPALAKTWTIDPASSITFTGTQGGDTFNGGFKAFNVAIDFDPDHPETGKISASIDIASVYAGSADRDNALPQPEWFDTKQFPQAQFTSTAIRWDRNPAQPMLKENIGCYQVQGNLTIKGMTKDVTMPFCIAPQNNDPNSATHARGKITLMRNDFDIGQGQFASDSFVKYNVDVTVDILAR